MIAFTIKRSDIISSISKTDFEVPNALISGCWREAWYSLSLSPPSASHVGVRYSAEIVTNGNEKASVGSSLTDSSVTSEVSGDAVHCERSGPVKDLRCGVTEKSGSG